MVRAPRVPTQREIDAHEATHIPHEELCETCIAGRGRNKPHRKRNTKEEKVPGGALEAGDTSDGSLADDAPVKGPVPRVCMDYFYVASRKVGHAMSTKELQRRLREMGKSDKGQRGALMRRYEMYADLEDQEEVQAGASTDVPTPSGGAAPPMKISWWYRLGCGIPTYESGVRGREPPDEEITQQVISQGEGLKGPYS